MSDLDAVKAVEKAIEERRARLEALEKGEVKPIMRNFRYVVDFQIPMMGQETRLAQPDVEVTKSFTVKKDTNFYVKSIEAAYSATGVLVSNGQAATVPYSAIFRLNVFDFVWKVRDTGSDREWTNGYMDSRVLQTGQENGLRFKRGHVFLSGGSEVVVTVGIIFNNNDPVQTGLSSISNNLLQFSFPGIEVYP